MHYHYIFNQDKQMLHKVKNTSSQNDIFSVDMNTFRGEKDENCGVDFNLQIWWYIN